ncbi:unnamed protein product [Chrysodeixis includens]|uniref:Uncharacterized protein n=1 Tax=Chrysodeixis includens TaxID=689277 RepID=A0A9P0BU37_CHRIL|nr:unnamed protein product [Chrysodeixis includens]
MVSCECMFGIVLLSAVVMSGVVLAQPGLYPANITTCEQFERGARFNPYEIVDSMWKIFYFWSNTTEVYPIIFSLAAKTRVQKFRDVFETVSPGEEVEWHKATLVMEPRPGIEVMFLYAGTPGAFRAIIKHERRTKERPHPLPLIKFADVRMKLVSRFLGMMCCEDLTAFALVRVGEIPKTEELCEKAASFIGYQGHPGRSYISIMNDQKEEEL